MKAVVLIGYAGHGQVCARAIIDAGFDLIGYCDNEPKKINPYNLTYLGTEQDWILSANHSAAFFVGIGNNEIRKRVAQSLLEHKDPVTLVEQRGAIVSEGVIAKELVLIAMGATVQVGVELGIGCIINTSASVDHDCLIGDYVHIAPGATLTGAVTIGNGAFVGANATVLPGLHIGANATLGAGSVLTKSIPPGEIWVGNPARPLNLTT